MVKLTALKSALKTAPKFSKNSLESVVLTRMSEIFLIYGEKKSFA